MNFLPQQQQRLRERGYFQFLKSQLLELVEVSKLVEQKDRFFILKFDQWLKINEAKLKEFGFAEASHLSVYKTPLINCKNQKVKNKQKIATGIGH